MVIIGLFLNKEIRTGANRRYLELMEALAKRGNGVYVAMNALLDYEPEAFVRVPIGIPYVRKGFPPASFLFEQKAAEICRLLRDSIAERGSGSPDWIHIHGDMHLPLAVKLKKAFGAKFFFAYRCNDIRRARILRAMGAYEPREYLRSLAIAPLDASRERTVARHADLVTFQNGADRDDFISRTGYPECRTVLIPGNIGLPRFLPEWENRNRSMRVEKLLYVGVLTATKGFRTLLEAMSLLDRRGMDGLKLTVLGKTEGAGETMLLVDRLGLSNRVFFAGYANPFPYLADSDLLVYPTLYDAFPDAVLEALHTGCPAIAADTGGMRDLLGTDDALFPVGDAPALADRIEELAHDNLRYSALKVKCMERARVFRFDWAGAFEQAMLAP